MEYYQELSNTTSLFNQYIFSKERRNLAHARDLLSLLFYCELNETYGELNPDIELADEMLGIAFTFVETGKISEKLEKLNTGNTAQLYKDIYLLTGFRKPDHLISYPWLDTMRHLISNSDIELRLKDVFFEDRYRFQKIKKMLGEIRQTDRHREDEAALPVQLHISVLEHPERVFMETDLQRYDEVHKELHAYLDRKLKDRKEEFLALVEEKGFTRFLLDSFYLTRLIQCFNTPNHYTIPDNRKDLVEQLLDEYVAANIARHYETSRGSESQKKHLLKYLQKVAVAMSALGKNEVTHEELSVMLKHDREVMDLIGHSTLLINDGHVYHFLHEDVQAYLTAQVLAKWDFETVTGMAALRPDYKKIKPFWASALYFLSQLLAAKDKKAKDQLINWVAHLAPEIVIKFEPAIIEEVKRTEIFTRIFSGYRASGRVVNHQKYNYAQLMQFAAGRGALAFLMHELLPAESIHARLGALYLLAAYPKNAVLQEFTEVLKEVLEFSIYKAEGLEAAVSAYVHLFKLRQAEIDTLIAKFADSHEVSLRDTVFVAIRDNQLQDVYVEQLLNWYKRIFDGEAPYQNGKSVEGRILEDNLSKLQSANAIVIFLNHYIGEKQKGKMRHIFMIEGFGLLRLIIESATKAYPRHEEIYNLILQVAIFDNLSDPVIHYLRDAGREKELWEEIKSLPYHEDHIDQKKVRQQMIILAVCSDSNIAQQVAEAFLANQLAREVIKTYRTFLRDELTQEFDELAGEKMTLIEQADTQPGTEPLKKNDIEILLSKEKFIEQVKRIFIKRGNDTLTVEELPQGIQETQDIPKAVFEVIIKQPRQEDGFKEEQTLEWLEKNWNHLSMGHLSNYLDQFDEKEIAFFKNWCDEKSTRLNFKNACFSGQNSPESIELNGEVLFFSHFVRKHQLYHYQTSVYLNLLLADDKDNLELFDFVTEKVGLAQIKQQVIENLKKGVLTGERIPVLRNHLAFAELHQIKEIVPHLPQYLKNKGSEDRPTVLHTYLRLGGSLHALDALLPQVIYDFKDHSWPSKAGQKRKSAEDEFRDRFLYTLISLSSKKVEAYLEKEFKKTKDREEKLNIVSYLIMLQNTDALEYMVTYLSAPNAALDPAFFLEPFYNFTSLDAVTPLLEMYEISFGATFGGAHRLNEAIPAALISIALHGNQFRRVRLRIENYLYSRQVKGFFRKKNRRPGFIRALRFLIENSETAYYQKHPADWTLREAVRFYEKKMGKE